jgi:hypothetical protein
MSVVPGVSIGNPELASLGKFRMDTINVGLLGRNQPLAQRIADRARHDRLVEVVDKMLALVPKLRAARADGERATLQNAVTATDAEIDHLVYELYGLTAEEIKIVEGE